MIRNEEKLSAFLDGELPEDEAREIEAALATDPNLLADLESLMAVDEAIKVEFDTMLDDPTPVGLVAAIKDAPISGPANQPNAPSMGRWLSAAAAVSMLAIGGIGGYFTAQSQDVQIAAAGGWLADIADYHRVYSDQQRHLVEVGAEESDHIQKWLTASIGDDVRIPDLSAYGLTFKGARLLVAAGKPVSQLMYTDAQNRIVALCQIQSDAPREDSNKTTIGAFDLVAWGGERSNFVVVGDEGRVDLSDIAKTAATQI